MQIGQRFPSTECREGQFVDRDLQPCCRLVLVFGDCMVIPTHPVYRALNKGRRSGRTKTDVMVKRPAKRTNTTQKRKGPISC